MSRYGFSGDLFHRTEEKGGNASESNWDMRVSEPKTTTLMDRVIDLCKVIRVSEAGKCLLVQSGIWEIFSSGI